MAELPPFSLIFLLLLISSTFSYSMFTSNNHTDLSSLLSFKSNVADPTGILASSWTTNTSFCNWFGISCSRRRQRVTSIDLYSVRLQGTISPHLANLSFLSFLDVSNCSLYGHIPVQLAYMRRISTIALESNSLSGHIPRGIFNVSSLKAFSVIYNSLTGSIPAVISLPRLRIIALSFNQLTGTIPSTFANCARLEILSLSNNLLSGSIPTEFGNLLALTRLYLGANRLTGTVPTSLGNLSNLALLDLSWNMLEGTIPGELGAISVLSHLQLGPNNLTGPIPTALLNASNVNILDLDGNKLTGTVPMRIGESMPLLTVLRLGGNRLAGGLEFLTSLSSCRNLEVLSVADNLLEGVLPHSVGNLSEKLSHFYAYENHITGNIPKELGNLSSLISINLAINELSGGIPPSLARLRSLQAMNLGSNQLSRIIPVDIGLMTGLTELYFEENALSGPIPNSLSNISRLQILSLSANRLVSTIPNTLWSLRGLTKLYLSDNSLDGPLSQQIGNLTNLISLNFSKNSLSDNIPSALGELVMLTSLDLSDNSFHGQIPQSFGGLINVEYVNLSHNFISGTIPKSLSNLRYLSALDLSFNRLEGPIPGGRVFSNRSIPSLIGNEALCGAPNLGFAPCSLEGSDASGSKQNPHTLKYVLPSIAFLITVVLLVSLYLLFRHRRRDPPTDDDDASLVDYRRISYYELVKATENFSDASILGRGSVGTVYKALLDDGLLVAVKILNLDVQGASKSFAAECEALRMVRHRNLVRIVSVCCNDDFKALVLQFMPNGSIEKWLYSSENYCLSTLQRVDIAIDVSLALEYLHHHHHYTVVHRDLKPSNVLMDEDMVAHVGDFGIAKLLHDESISVMSATTPGTIGYMAPEYGSTGRVSREGDVYSFGILLLEMCTRKRPTDAIFDGESNMREWVSKAYPTEVLKIIDCNLIKAESSNEQETSLPAPSIHQCLSSMIELGLLCSRESPKERPQMKDVVPKLQNIKMNYTSMLHAS